MTEISLFVSFAVLLLIGVVSPGPAFFVTTQYALSDSKLVAVINVIGIALVNVLFAFIAMTGLSALTESKTTLGIIQFVGACYLFYIAYRLFRTQPIGDNDIGRKKGNAFRYLAGGITQLTNPKAFLFVTSAVTYSFQGELDLPFRTLIVLAITFLVSFFWYFGVCLLIGQATIKSFLVDRLHIVSRCSSIIIAFMASRMLIDLL